MAKTAKTAAPQTRWAWVEIDLAALRRNTHTFKSLLVITVFTKNRTYLTFIAFFKYFTVSKLQNR